MPVSRNASCLSVMFDDDHAVADAGLALAGVLSEKLGLLEPTEELVDVRPFPKRRVATLVHAMVVGAEHIEDADLLRSASTAEVLGHRVMAPSTLGTLLRKFDFGHVRQLDRLAQALLARAWATGAGPSAAPMTIDVDSSVCGVHGKKRQGAAYGDTKVLGCHALLATRSETGEVLHVRFAKGSTGSGRAAERFVREVVGSVRRCGASGPPTLRADSRFYSAKVMKACRDHGVAYSITAAQNPSVRAAIEQIDGAAWTPTDDTQSGEAWMAETGYQGHRLFVRRTTLTEAPPALFPTFRSHAFVTSRIGDAVFLEPITGATRWSSSRPATWRRAPDCHIFRPGASGRTAPVPCSRASPTTWCAGSPCSG